MLRRFFQHAAIRAALPVALLTLPAAGLHATVISVPDTANIMGAGHAAPPNPGGGGAGTLPPSFAFTANSGFLLQMTSVVGTTSLTPGFDGVNGEGNASFSTNITSYGGLSGIIDTNRSGFLVGVFLDDSEPVSGTEPARLTFSSPNNFTTLSPALRQTFLIGDGKADDSGATQSFVAPAGATRLFLGFADGPGYNGAPGAFQDNSGRALTVTFGAATPAATGVLPAPSLGDAGLLLLGAGLIGGAALGLRRRRTH